MGKGPRVRKLIPFLSFKHWICSQNLLQNNVQFPATSTPIRRRNFPFLRKFFAYVLIYFLVISSSVKICSNFSALVLLFGTENVNEKWKDVRDMSVRE